MASTQTKDELASEERRTKARLYFNQATGQEGYTADRTRWGTLWQFQKTCKKGWDKLGFTAREIERIKLNKPDWI